MEETDICQLQVSFAIASQAHILLVSPICWLEVTAQGDWGVATC